MIVKATVISKPKMQSKCGCITHYENKKYIDEYNSENCGLLFDNGTKYCGKCIVGVEVE